MKLITIGTTIKYKGERYYPNVPFDLNVEEIPKELQGIVKEYVENEMEQKQFQSNRKNRNDGLLKKDVKVNVAKPSPKAVRPKTKQEKKEQQNNDDLLNVGFDLDNLG